VRINLIFGGVEYAVGINYFCYLKSKQGGHNITFVGCPIEATACRSVAKPGRRIQKPSQKTVVKNNNTTVLLCGIVSG
jgi:hypothetical protein